VSPPVDLSSLLAQIEAVLDCKSDVARIERTLTDGYAHALALEAERWRLERRIGEIARLLGHGDTAGRAAELTSLSRRLERVDVELDELRSTLARLRRHADAVRAA
jgi:ABC-type phosphate transport system auxiliary subunit